MELDEIKMMDREKYEEGMKLISLHVSNVVEALLWYGHV